mmetsp:Transcript_33967/g.76902  ORF Transcript_33967/g.76902 Transcript_33967/m.76902 type:complete len:215 (+) Transcript_33967:1454-2098(+)
MRCAQQARPPIQLSEHTNCQLRPPITACGHDAMCSATQPISCTARQHSPRHLGPVCPQPFCLPRPHHCLRLCLRLYRHLCLRLCLVTALAVLSPCSRCVLTRVNIARRKAWCSRVACNTSAAATTLDVQVTIKLVARLVAVGLTSALSPIKHRQCPTINCRPCSVGRVHFNGQRIQTAASPALIYLPGAEWFHRAQLTRGVVPLLSRASNPAAS